jgi:hypothetical protein
VGDLAATFIAERVEEPRQRLRITAWGGPHQPAGVVVDHDHQILVPTLV